jgi:hypothetical protein
VCRDTHTNPPSQDHATPVVAQDDAAPATVQEDRPPTTPEAHLWGSLVSLDQALWRVMPASPEDHGGQAKDWEAAAYLLLKAQQQVASASDEYLHPPAPTDTEVPLTDLLEAAEAALAQVRADAAAEWEEQAGRSAAAALARTRQVLLP